MKYLLDTHAAVWLLEGNPSFGKKAARLLAAETRDSVAISDISLLEISMLHQRGSIVLTPNAIDAMQQFTQHLTVLPIDARIAADAVVVALPHKDPFDRVITATARVHDLVLVTKDEHITKARVVATVW